MLNSTAQESGMSAQKWWLHIQSRRFELERGKSYLIGRLPDNGSSSEAAAYIAVSGGSLDAKHSLLDVLNNSVRILDLCSQLGTFINEDRLESLKYVNVNVEATLRFGEVSAQLCFEESEGCRDSSGFHEEHNRLDDTSSNKPAGLDNFLMPAAPPARKSDSANTSARLFDDDSFNVPETQHVRSRASTGDPIILEASLENSLLGKLDDDNDESFIPETQQIGDNTETMTIDANMPKSFDMFRICTQDFNENLFGDDVDDDAFTSLVIPKIQQKAVVLENVMLAPPETTNTVRCSDGLKQQDVSGDAEMAALNWSEQTRTLNDTTQSTQCAARDDTCTPDLFDLPQLAQANVQFTTTEMPKEMVPTVGAATAGLHTSINRQITSIDMEVDAKETCPVGIELMATQVFVPAPKKEQQQEQQLSEELSPSGKENQLPENVETAMEATQIFIKPKGCESKHNHDYHLECNIAQDEADANLQTAALYPPTQVFPVNNNKTLAIKALNSTCMPAKGNEQAKSAASFFEKMEVTLQKSEKNESLANETDKKHGFKKPKREVTVKNMKASSDTTLAETDDFHLCTPKWIQDNFDELALEQKAISTRKRVLFGSDSEDEVDHVDKLMQKKVSNDFGKLLCKVKDQDAMLGYEIKKQSRKSDRPNVPITVQEVSTKRNSRSEANIRDNENDKFVEKKREPKVRIKREYNKPSKDSVRAQQSTSNVSTKEQTDEDVPVRRLTRLRSQASSAAKDTELKHFNDGTSKEVSKPRITRMNSKINSYDEKSEEKQHSRSKRAKSATKHTKAQETSDHSATRKAQPTNSRAAVNTSSECIKSKSQECTSASKYARQSRKRRESVTTNEMPKRLRSTSTQEQQVNNRHKIQVATTMVDLTSFQSLLDNAQGHWSIATNPAEADILIMDKGTRTFKFLLAMAKGIPIVTSKWLESLNTTKVVPKGMEHYFKDAEFEKRHKFSLLKSMDVARKQKIFDGYEFLTTSGILPQPSDMKEIIKCAGGVLHDEVPSPKKQQKIFLVSTPNDKKYWHKYRRSNANIQITSTEGVMAAVMRQQIQPLEMYKLA